MASRTDIVLPTSSHGFAQVQSDYRRLVEDPTNGISYKGGASLTLSDTCVMKINFDPKASLGFWKRSDPNTKSVLEGSLEENFNDPDSVLNERNVYKEELTKCDHPKIDDAYSTSTEYCRVIEYLINETLFENEALVNSYGEFLFQGVGVSFYWSHINMESHMVFSTPGYPHIIILSLQPHRTLSQREVLYTESWTLLYWARKFAHRALDTTANCLPIRLVSLCGYEARAVSAVFSLGYLRCLVPEIGHGKSESLTCQIHVAEYRDLSLEQPFRELMEEMIVAPCGNAGLQQRYSEEQKG